MCVYSTYQQLYSVPAALGAKVSLWRLRKEKKYIPDIDELKTLVKENTNMIIINNPNDSTGATIPKSVLQEVIYFANLERDIFILSDEVYRPIFHGISRVPLLRSVRWATRRRFSRVQYPRHIPGLVYGSDGSPLYLQRSLKVLQLPGIIPRFRFLVSTIRLHPLLFRKTSYTLF